MRKFFTLMSHNLTAGQENQAREIFDISEFINITDDAWASIDPSLDSIKSCVKSYQNSLEKMATKGDILLVQGDFGATYEMVKFAKNLELKVVYATTKRTVREVVQDDGKVVSVREFKHERFREYEN